MENKCDICDKILSTKQALVWHIRVHIGENPFKCKVCSKQFSEAGSLQAHWRFHTGEKPFKYVKCVAKSLHAVDSYLNI